MEKLLECARPIASDLLLPPLTKLVNAIKDAPKDVAGMKDQLDLIQAMIHEADRMAEAQEDSTVRSEIMAKVKHMIETSFGMEDIMDEYAIREEQQPGCVALPCMTLDFAKAMTSRLKFSYMNEDVKSEFQGVKEERNGNQNQTSLEEGWSTHGGNKNATLRYLQDAPLYIKDADVVGFDVPKRKLIDWSVNEERKERSVMCVVAQGGQGKTTLVKKVFDSKQVVQNFAVHVWITVSQSYTVEAVLRDMLQKLCKETRQSLLQNVAAMDRSSLIEEVRRCLSNKRYVVTFDDVWNPDFWMEMEFALIDDENGSRIFITTRKRDVAMRCKRSVCVQMHELLPLTLDMSLDLFHKKVFGTVDGCPNNLRVVSKEIVGKCCGLPLGIVAIGGLLSQDEDKDPVKWKSFSQNLSSELGKRPDLTPVTTILALSYHDFPSHLKQCFLYFGIFPENYGVNCKRLIQLWVAEGFVQLQHKERKTLEEVAYKYLTDLIERSLVQVSSFTGDYKVKSCHVHDLVRDMILKKVDDLSFCHHDGELDNQSKNGMIRRLTTTSTSDTNLMESPIIRSLHFFIDFFGRESYRPLHYSFQDVRKNYRLLKVLGLDWAPSDCIPKKLEGFPLLRYLSLSHTDIECVPRSVGMLHNLETLDVRKTEVREIPREVKKLKRLRHLRCSNLWHLPNEGICMEDGIEVGDLASLETLLYVEIQQCEELERLLHLKVLGFTGVRPGNESAVCSSINKMKHLRILKVAAHNFDQDINMNFQVSAPLLSKLCLVGILETFPIWVSQLPYLAKLTLVFTALTEDPLTLLKDLPNLLCLQFYNWAYEGECLHFPDRGFENLKQLVIGKSSTLNSIRIDRGALPQLKSITLSGIPNLKVVPFGVYHLPKLEVVYSLDMAPEFVSGIDPNRGNHQWVIKRVEH